MSDHSQKRDFVVGLNSSLKLIRTKKAKKIYLACDADSRFVEKVMNALSETDIELDENFTAAQLAEKYGIDVPSAIVTIF